MNRIAHSLLLGAIIAAAWGPRNALAADVVGARMTCSDPSGSFIANLDSATFQKMALVTQAMAAAPSGLSCNLEQIPPSPGHGSKNFAVGGGQFLDSCGGAPFPVNFAFSAHSDADGSNVNGTVDLTFPANQSCFPESHETGMVQCLTVVANNANFSGPITHATGAFSNNRFFEGHATDNGNPQDGQPVDTLSVFGELTFTGCAFNIPGQFPISKGNIVVHQGVLP